MLSAEYNKLIKMQNNIQQKMIAAKNSSELNQCVDEMQLIAEAIIDIEEELKSTQTNECPSGC